MLFNLYGKLAQANVDGPDAFEDEVKRVNPTPRGPVKLRHITNGQLRRMDKRTRDAQTRKRDRKYRRTWLSNEIRIAALRGQLQVLHDETGAHSPALVANAHRAVVEKYGSVDKASETYGAIMAEKKARR